MSRLNNAPPSTAPAGITVEQTEHGMRLTHRVFSASAMGFSVVFIVLFVVVAVVNVVAAAQGAPTFGACVMVPSAALAVLGSVGVYQAVWGRFVIEVTPEQVCERAVHVPLAPRLRVADAREIVAMKCTYARVGKDYFDLWARLRNGQLVRLIEAIHSREAAFFLRRTLARALHVREDPNLERSMEAML